VAVPSAGAPRPPPPDPAAKRLQTALSDDEKAALLALPWFPAVVERWREGGGRGRGRRRRPAAGGARTRAVQAQVELLCARFRDAPPTWSAASGRDVPYTASDGAAGTFDPPQFLAEVLGNFVSLPGAGAGGGGGRGADTYLTAEQKELMLRELPWLPDYLENVRLRALVREAERWAAAEAYEENVRLRALLREAERLAESGAE